MTKKNQYCRPDEDQDPRGAQIIAMCWILKPILRQPPSHKASDGQEDSAAGKFKACPELESGITILGLFQKKIL